MAEEIKNTNNEGSTDLADNQGQSPEKTFTQEELTKELQRVGKKERASGETAGRRAALESLGFESNDDISAFKSWKEISTSDEYIAYLEAKKNKETDSDRLKAADKRIKELEEAVNAAKNDHTAVLQTLSGYKQKEVLIKHGVTDAEDLELYSIRISKLVNDDTPFEDAADNYFKQYPFKQKEEKPKPTKVELYGGLGKTNKNIKSTNFTQALFGKR